MPITVSCVCGRKLKAPDSFAGKKAKCPNCGKVLAIPASAVPVPVAPAPQQAVPGQIDLADAPPPAAPAPAAPSLVPGQPLPGSEPSDGYDLDLDLDLEKPTNQDQGMALISSLQTHDAPAPAPAHGVGLQQVDPPQAMSQLSQAQATMNREEYRRAAADNGPKSFGTFMGKDLTIMRLISWGIIAAAIGIGASWWFSSPTSVVSVQNVDTIVVFDAIKEPKGFTWINPMAPVEGGDLALGGRDWAIATHPNPNGDYVIVHLRSSQKFFKENGLDARYEIGFIGGKFELQSGGQKEPARLLRVILGSGESFTTGGGTLYPQAYPPSDQTKKKGQNGHSGTYTFDGANGATGQIEYMQYESIDGFGGGVTATGNLRVTDKSMNIEYQYAGESVSVFINDGDALWHSTNSYNVKDEVSPFHKWDVLLLFKRPAKTGDMSLLLGGKQIATVSNTPGSSPSFASLPAAQSKRTAPSNPLSLAMKMKNKKNKNTKKGGGISPLPSVLDMYSAASGSRDKAKGLVSKKNMEQILIYIQLYRDAHNSKAPDSIVDLIEFAPEMATIMRNPLSKDKWGYIYVKLPPEADPHETPVLYEATGGKPDPNGLKGYLDGRIK